MAPRILSVFMAAVVAVLLPESAMAAGTEHFTVRPRELPYQVGTYPLVSGRYTLLSVANAYVLFDDSTGRHTTIRPGAGSGCDLWANAFAAPWLLFYCVNGAGPTLYNIHTHQWTGLPCGQACENIGLAAPDAMGSDWVEINENAYCDPRFSPCDTPDAFVAIPSGRPGSYTASPTTLLDLNSPTLSQPICAPWSQPPNVSISLDGTFVVLQTLDGVGVARCGATSILPLLTGANAGLAETAHLVASCPTTNSPYGLSQPGPYSGVFLPSLRRFTLTLPPGFMPCSAYFDDGALYLDTEPGDHVWRARLPTGPLPTYPSCPRGNAISLQSTNSEAYQRLVPNGAGQVLLCSYGPRTRPRLIGQRLITSHATVSTLIRTVDHLRPSHGPGRCPADTGTSVTAFFRYSSADDVPMTINLTGCWTVSNGHIRRTPSGRSGQALLERLQRLA